MPRDWPPEHTSCVKKLNEIAMAEIDGEMQRASTCDDEKTSEK